MQIVIIVALAENNVIGKKGDIPWRIKDDFKRFKEITTGHPCIMGDKTYESLPPNAKPLPGRENIILTFDKNYHPLGTTVFYSFDDAINYCKEKKYDKVFICGGGFVYKQAISFADSLELTRIHKNVDGDIFFPEINFDEWKLVKEDKHTDPVMGDYSFMSYIRKNKTNIKNYANKEKFIDLVISGPDMSGTSTQLNDIINFFKSIGKKVRDIRGTEVDALFHAKVFSEYNSNYSSLQEFLLDKNVSLTKKNDFIFNANKLLFDDLKVASFVNNAVSTYIDFDSADVWIMEEPTKRGAGQVNRTIEQQRSLYGSHLDPIAAACCHQAYRIDEFLRFRKILREKNKIIIRSRSEESACYQVYDKTNLPNGISKEQYLSLPGHKIAFKNPPTHIFIVSAKENWTKDEWLALKKERSQGRLLDDYELFAEYQLLVNKRYASSWINDLYNEGCKRYGAIPPSIIKFSIYDSKEQIKTKMFEELKKIMN